MSDLDLNIFELDKAGLIDFYGDLKRKDRSQWFPTNETLRSQIHWLNREEENANFRFKFIRCNADYGETIQTETCSFAVRLEASEDKRPLFIKFPNEVHISDVNGDKTVKTECLLLAMPTAKGQVTLASFPQGASLITSTLYVNNNPVYTEYTTSIRDALKTDAIYDSNIGDYVNWKISGDGTGGVLHRRWSRAQKDDIIAKLTAISSRITYGYANAFNMIQDYPYWDTQLSTMFNGACMLRYETDMLMTYDELPFPLFDYTQVDDIVNYINTGDSSGALDVFDKENPKAEHIEDWKTNMQVFISPEESDKKKTHLTIVAYNNDLINNFDTIEDDVRLHTVVQGATAGGQAFFAPMGKYPTQNLVVSNFPDNGLDLYSALYQDNPYTHSNYFGIHLKPKANSAVHCRVDFATHSDSYPQTTQQTYISKTQIVDGYRYTDTNTGEWVEVIFRAITLDDLKDYKYKNPEDNEDDQSGTDGTFTTGGGLRTYSITKEMFNTINNSLWSTDWTSVFKSTTVNPISCVIACKAIPFTAPTSGTDTVMIANMNSGVTASYVTPVKSFAVGSVNIPSYAGDFTDITLTHIRCYLPYIGWVELPASECIERVAYPTVGIEARHKHLSFKYIVDFVDGAVRCVVSVNGTERWFFDGNCSIDVPVTSDNHTQAVSNAIRSGVQTGLSIVTAVAGAYAGNAGAVAGGVMGAMQSAPNIFPTYSFTATSNGSGYINASMNQHIMLVIEHPNVIRSADYAKRVGVPCGLSLNLGSLHGYTRCVDVNVTGIDATPNEIQRIKSMLESGVYL